MKVPDISGRPPVNNKLYHPLFIVCLLLVLALSLRMVNLGKEYSGDEGSLIDMARMDFNKMAAELRGREIYPPLTYSLVHLWLFVRDSTAWIRMYFVLFGTGVCLLVYLIAREYTGRRFALLVLLLAAISPLLISTSQIIRSYIDSAFWSLLSVFFMLRIIKGRRGIFNWAGYIISLALSLYTFYFSALLIFSQFAYIVIFMRRDKKLVFKWFMSLVLAFLIFAPWLPSALTQFHNASSISFDWSDKGFNVGFLRFGLYARNLVSVAGLDPSFMVFPGGVQAHFSKTVLAAVAAAVSAAFALLFYAGFIFLKERSKDQVDSRVLWLPFWLVFLPLLLSWLAAGLFNMLPNARYLTVMHSMFLMLIAASIGYLWSRNRRVSILALVLVVLLFASRIPAAVSTEFEYRESVSFLKDNIAKDDRIICVIPPPDVSLAGNVVVIDEKYADLNAQKSAYLPLPGQVWQDIRKKIRSRHRVWFYRPQGHFELFGLYSQIDSFLKDEGYKAKKTYRFRNIDIIELETRG